MTKSVRRTARQAHRPYLDPKRPRTWGAMARTSVANGPARLQAMTTLFIENDSVVGARGPLHVLKALADHLHSIRDRRSVPSPIEMRLCACWGES
jgi:hypothetical protein